MDESKKNRNGELAGQNMQPLQEFDQNHFYETDHLDATHFNEENRSSEDLGYQEISGTATVSGRLDDEASLDQDEEEDLTPNTKEPGKADGDKLMDVGRAPDS